MQGSIASRQPCPGKLFVLRLHCLLVTFSAFQDDLTNYLTRRAAADITLTNHVTYIHTYYCLHLSKFTDVAGLAANLHRADPLPGQQPRHRLLSGVLVRHHLVLQHVCVVVRAQSHFSRPDLQAGYIHEWEKYCHKVRWQGAAFRRDM